MDITIFGDGEQTRAFSYINDSLEPLWKSSQQENCSKEIINLGGIKEYSIKEAAEILKAFFNAFPGVKEYMNESIEKARKKG